MRSKVQRRKPAAVPRRKAGRGAGNSARRPLLTRAEVRHAVIELANVLAPADVGDLLTQEAALRARARQLGGSPGRLLRRQLDLALACLRDHAAGACPQIPFYAVSVLAAGVAYLGEPLDLVPDFLRGTGTLDDALVMAMACDLGADGLRRYCTWKGIDPAPALGRPRREAS